MITCNENCIILLIGIILYTIINKLLLNEKLYFLTGENNIWYGTKA